MCGIGGVLSRTGVVVHPTGLQRMGAAMRARGPDDEGFFQEGGLGLVHRRLSILDLRPLAR